MAEVWVGTGWKMNKTLAQARDYVDVLNARTQWPGGVRPFVLPPHTALATVANRLRPDSPVLVGAQNAHWAPDGPFTGEISMAMAADAGARIVEIGHSERRTGAAESDYQLARKVRAALQHGLIPLLCVGEPREVRDAGGSATWILGQLATGLSMIDPADRGRVLIAYEPIWAIGEHGRPAEPGEMAEAFELLTRSYGRGSGHPVRAVLYGGSVTAANAGALLEVPGVGGLFVGRYALRAEGLLELIGIAAAAAGG